MRGRWAWVVVVALAAAGLVAVWTVWRPNGETGIRAVRGIVETTPVEVSARITGRIAELRAREGQRVERGQVLVVLDASALAAEVSRAEGRLQAAEAQRRDLEAGPRPEEIREAEARAARAQTQLNELLASTRVEEIEQARAAHRKSRVYREWNQRELARAREFLAKEFIAAQDVERAKQTYDSAVANEFAARERLVRLEAGPRQHEIEALRAELTAARERVQKLRAGARPQDVAAARARVARGRATLDLARARLGEARLLSPIAGIVLRTSAAAGETVNPGVSIVTLMDPGDLWVRAYVAETGIQRIRLGQEAAISVNAYPGRVFAGQVSEIASEAEFAVKVTFRNLDVVLTPGLPADVEIRP